ncbi:Spc97 / Spc98 family of spindle pole body (SBP)component [Striga asiatica]|uniref:Spc97 / Spc98 family of spindle pole body (SBP)component n=1 Tax=Striga asiatica TaxID=4170 RepID=A0A5A7QAK0_STRAF|nr:Spc97 / Spc98 family of spindle pole body (SBP)component [Striga asiatica]
MDARTVLGRNDIDDVRWLCSLSESEIDFLMGLKTMVNMRAEKIGREVLAKKFDLGMLRILSSVFMEHLKGQLKDKPAAFAFDCNLLKENVSDDFGSMSVEDLFPYFCSDQRKRITDMFLGDMPPSQKQKKQKQASEDSI